MRRFLKFTHQIKNMGDACSMNEGEVHIGVC